MPNPSELPIAELTGPAMAAETEIAKRAPRVLVVVVATLFLGTAILEFVLAGGFFYAAYSFIAPAFSQGVMVPLIAYFAEGVVAIVIAMPGIILLIPGVLTGVVALRLFRGRSLPRLLVYVLCIAMATICGGWSWVDRTPATMRYW